MDTGYRCRVELQSAMDTPNYYKILGVEPNASTNEINVVFKRLAKEWHPDIHPEKGTAGEAWFKEITRAHAILRDPLARREHDKNLAQEVTQGHWERTEYYRRAQATADQYASANYEKFVADLETVLGSVIEGTAQFVEYSNRKAEETTALGCAYLWYFCIFLSLYWAENRFLSVWFDSFHLSGGEGVAAMLTLLAVNIILSHLIFFQIIDRGWRKSPAAVLGTFALVGVALAVAINLSSGSPAVEGPAASASVADVRARKEAENAAKQKAAEEERARVAKRKERDSEIESKLVGRWSPNWSVSFISNEAGYQDEVKGDYLEFKKGGSVKGTIIGDPTSGKWSVDEKGEIFVDFTSNSILQGAIYLDDENANAEGLPSSLRFGGKYDSRDTPWFYRK